MKTQMKAKMQAAINTLSCDTQKMTSERVNKYPATLIEKGTEPSSANADDSNVLMILPDTPINNELFPEKTLTQKELAEKISDQKDLADELGPVRTKPKGKTGCFVAGTLVHTQNGLVPIEKIRVGDMVLSQPEEQGEHTYKPVVNTFAFEDKEIYRLSYANNCDSKEIPEEAQSDDNHPFWKNIIPFENVFVTGNHPFWVKGADWTVVDWLAPGDVLELENGDSATVWEIQKVFSTNKDNVGFTFDNWEDPGKVVEFHKNSTVVSNDKEEIYAYETVRDDRSLMLRQVFNIEVADCHTYYIGELGVWVHNTRDCGGENIEQLKQPETALLNNNWTVIAT